MWPRGPNWSHHEVLFIRTHQAFEVWFGVVLHELSTVLLEAKERCGLDGNQVQQVRLGDRAQAAREFSPNRFPKLANVAKSFHHDFIKNRVFMLPAPGRHSLPPGVHLPEETLRRLSASVQRAAVALKVTIPFFDVLTTLTPKQFLEFRNRLAPASGFGSTQFRELEMVFGLRELSQKRIAPTKGVSDKGSGAGRLPEGMLRPTKATPPAEAQTCFVRHHLPSHLPRLAARFREPSLRDLVYGLLNANVFEWRDSAAVDATLDEFAALTIRRALADTDRRDQIDEDQVGDLIEGLGEVLSHKETAVAALLAMKRLSGDQPALQSFLEACLELDAALLRWRDQHVRFVESIIGRRPGTGGAGVNYLRSTTDPALAGFLTHAFPCLWQARTIVQHT